MPSIYALMGLGLRRSSKTILQIYWKKSEINGMTLFLFSSNSFIIFKTCLKYELTGRVWTMGYGKIESLRRRR